MQCVRGCQKDECADQCGVTSENTQYQRHADYGFQHRSQPHKDGRRRKARGFKETQHHRVEGIEAGELAGNVREEKCAGGDAQHIPAAGEIEAVAGHQLISNEVILPSARPNTWSSCTGLPGKSPATWVATLSRSPIAEALTGVTV